MRNGIDNKKLSKQEQDQKNLIYRQWKAMTDELVFSAEEFMASANEANLNRAQQAYFKLANAVEQRNDIPDTFNSRLAFYQDTYNKAVGSSGIQKEYRLARRKREKHISAWSKLSRKSKWIIVTIIAVPLLIIFSYIANDSLEAKKEAEIKNIIEEYIANKFPRASNIEIGEARVSDGVETFSEPAVDHGEVNVSMIDENGEKIFKVYSLWKFSDESEWTIKILR